jgi:D-alanyl-D-alanine carboxypeptidase
MHRAKLTHILAAGLAMVLASAASCAADPRLDRAEAAVAASLPKAVAADVLARIKAAPERFLSLLEEADKESKEVPDLLRRVDKTVALPDSYVPTDLASLDGTGLSVARKGLSLRKEALQALLLMARAAKADGVTLVASSTYRSYEYQVEVFARTAREMGGEAAADRVSARPGHSQHQLGMALDFGSIDDSFAETKASRWLTANARRFGFSLSYPKGLEPVTGYAWESWHYRYIGKPAAALEGEYFGGVQQYLILFFQAFLPQ